MNYYLEKERKSNEEALKTINGQKLEINELSSKIDKLEKVFSLLKLNHPF